MSNTHLLPDMHAELQAWGGDLLPSVILSTTWPSGSGGMSLAPFATHGYVREATSPPHLYYVNQPAAGVTLTGTDGPYWIALVKDTHTAHAGWSRQAGTHYIWRAAASKPPDPAGGLILANLTVAGGVITAVNVSSTIQPRGRVAFGGADGTLTFDPLFTYDPVTHSLSLAVETPTAALDIQSQRAQAVQVRDFAIVAPSGLAQAFVGLVSAATGKWNLYMGGTGQNYLAGFLGIQTPGGVPGYPLHVAGAIYGTTSMGLGTTPGTTATLDIQPQTPVGVNVKDFFVAGAAHAYVGQVVAGTNKWNLYMSGGANNYLGGPLAIGVVGGVPTAALDVQSMHSVAVQVPDFFVSGSARAFSGLAMAGTGKWNLSMSGTAQNYLAGFLGINTPGGVPAYPLHVVGAIYGTTSMGLGTVPGTVAALRIQPQVGVGVQVDDFYISGQAIAYAGLVGAGGNKWNCYMGGTAGNYFAGNVGINSTNVTSWQLHVNGTLGLPGGSGAIINSTSHAALKQAIRPLTDASALIARLPVRQWEWADTAVEAQLPGTQAGFVIEEMAQVKPSWVRTGQDGQTGLATVGLDAYLVATMQEVLRRLDALEAAHAPK